MDRCTDFAGTLLALGDQKYFPDRHICSFFAYLVYPLVAVVDKYTRHRLPRTLLLGIVFAMIVRVALASAMLMGGRLVDEATRLSDQLPTLLDTNTLSQRIPLPGFLEPWRDRLIKFAVDQLKSGTDQALPFAQKVGKVFFHAATNLVYLVLVPLLSFLLIKEAPSLQQSLYRFVGGAERAAWVRQIRRVRRIGS